jgi:glutaredoxin
MDFSLPTPGKYTIYTKSGCAFCNKAKALLQEKLLEFEQIDCDEYLLSSRDNFLSFISMIANKDHKTFPMIFDPSGSFVGGFTEMKSALETQSHTLKFEEAF